MLRTWPKEMMIGLILPRVKPLPGESEGVGRSEAQAGSSRRRVLSATGLTFVALVAWTLPAAAQTPSDRRVYRVAILANPEESEFAASVSLGGQGAMNRLEQRSADAEEVDTLLRRVTELEQAQAAVAGIVSTLRKKLVRASVRRLAAGLRARFGLVCECHWVRGAHFRTLTAGRANRFCGDSLPGPGLNGSPWKPSARCERANGEPVAPREQAELAGRE